MPCHTPLKLHPNLKFAFKKLIAQEVNEDSALLSMVPEQGPFLVTLNVQEDIMQIYHFLLSRVYREIFGSELPHKPKPFRINLLLNAIFLGWLQLRTKVLQKFQLCKDIEFACILHLLDEVVPLSFFHYPVIFQSGNLSSYVPVMLRFALLFIIWRRHHYDRSTLSMLSDINFIIKNSISVATTPAKNTGCPSSLKRKLKYGIVY